MTAQDADEGAMGSGEAGKVGPWNFSNRSIQVTNWGTKSLVSKIREPDFSDNFEATPSRVWKTGWGYINFQRVREFFQEIRNEWKSTGRRLKWRRRESGSKPSTIKSTSIPDHFFLLYTHCFHSLLSLISFTHFFHHFYQSFFSLILIISSCLFQDACRPLNVSLLIDFFCRKECIRGVWNSCSAWSECPR